MTESAAPERPVRRRRPAAGPTGPVRVTANVCQAASCLSAQSDRVLDALADRVAEGGLSDVGVKRVGCLGLCAAGPLVSIPQTGEMFERVQADALDGLLDALRPRAAEPERQPTPAPFFARQVRIVTENSGLIDPESLEDYRGPGRLRRRSSRSCTSMSPAEVIDEIARSGLRGRGGAGYPDRPQVADVSQGTAGRKYVICNADEGDPGAFMDRSVLESDPHRVLEGMAIAGYAVGADTRLHLLPGRVSARGEPAGARRSAQAERAGLLG